MGEKNVVDFNVYDLCIKTLDDGTEVVQIDSRLAFNPSFVEEMKDRGVLPVEKREKSEDQEQVPEL